MEKTENEIFMQCRLVNSWHTAPPPIPPRGFTVEAAPLGDLGSALVGRTVLYWWSDDRDGC